MSFNKSIIALALSFTLVACGGSGSDDSGNNTTTPTTGFNFAATEMINNLTDDVIVAGYANLAQQAEAFFQATQTLVSSPTQVNLVAAQNAWKAARQPWEQGESHIFGPVDSLSIDPHLDTWPLNTTDLQSVINSNSNFSAESIRSSGDDVQGFHAMEYLLFGDGVADNTKGISELSSAEREYLMATAEVFRDYAVSLDDAWQVSYNPADANAVGYASLLKSAGADGNNFYSSDVGVIQELVQGLIGIVDEVGNGKIADPLGDSLANANTSVVESQYSWNSLADFADNIKGVRNIYQGEFLGAADKQGLVDFINAGDAALATKIATQIDDAILKIQNIAGSTNMPFRQAILDADGRVRIEQAVSALTTLQTTLEAEVVPLLGQWNGQ